MQARCNSPLAVGGSRHYTVRMDMTNVTAVTLFLSLALGLPLLGYVLLVLDVRAYYRALKRALVVASHFVVTKPEWVRRRAPLALQTLELEETCTEDEVRAAYRRLAERCHPDLGGDPQEFARLRRHYEDALEFARRRSSSS